MKTIKHGTQSGYRSGCKCNECKSANNIYSIKMKHARAAVGLPLDDPRHGTRSAYEDWMCRCDRCKAGNNEDTKRMRADRAKAIDPADPRHGKSTFYSNHGCRCQLCTTAWSATCKEQYNKRKAKKPSSGL